jgi:hypothetical protein
MTFKTLLILLGAAKVAGIAGVVALFCQHRTLSGALFLIDGILLALIVGAAYKSMTHQFAQPYEDAQ